MNYTKQKIISKDIDVFMEEVEPKTLIKLLTFINEHPIYFRDSLRKKTDQYLYSTFNSK